MRRLVIYGGSFDPPGAHRREIARRLAEKFDEVIVVPCGPRPDKPSTRDTSPIHRAVMADMTFRRMPGVRVELFDLEEAHFTPPQALEQRFHPFGEVWHAVIADMVRGGATQSSRIHTDWTGGASMWDDARFAVLRTARESLDPDDLPPHSVVIEIPEYIPSEAIRNQAFHRQPIDDLVVPEVASYMHRHRLYRATIAARESTFRLSSPRFRLWFDEKNERAAKAAERLRKYESDEPEAVVVLGGDGTMLHAIRAMWRERLPFFGMNFGHVGFLLNEAEREEFWTEELLLYQLPLLWVEVTLLDGEVRGQLAFNDTWVERSTGQSAWMSVAVDGMTRLNKVVADGMLISTAAGSTSYARAMGATPMPFNMRGLLLVGSNVLTPRRWQPVVMPIDSEVTLTTLDPEKRPLEAFVDGVGQGLVQSLHARVSHIAAVELAFRPGHDPASKLAKDQFRE